MSSNSFTRSIKEQTILNYRWMLTLEDTNKPEGSNFTAVCTPSRKVTEPFRLVYLPNGENSSCLILPHYTL